MAWQILEGASSIPVTLFEATADLDAGPIYLQQEIELQGHELMDEWRTLQAQATLDLCVAWFDRYREVVARVQLQQGEASHYRRRRPADSQLDPDDPWRSSSTCCGWSTTTAIRLFSTGRAAATAFKSTPMELMQGFRTRNRLPR